MITAGLAPSCPAAVHRLLEIAADGRLLDPLAWSPLAITFAFAMSIALLTALAIWSWLRGANRFGRGALLLAAYALHPPAVLPLTPFVLTRLPRSALRSRRPPAASKWTAMRIEEIAWSISVSVFAIALMAVTPHCAGVDVPGASPVVKDAVAVLREGVGLTVGLLALLEVVTRARSQQVQCALTIISLAVLAAFVMPEFDRRMTLVPSLVACWWLAFLAAVRLTLEPRSAAGRIVTRLMLAMIPMTSAAGLARGDGDHGTRMSWSTLRSTLERIPRPAALVNANPALSPWIAAWTAGLSDGAGSLVTVSPDSTAVERAMSARGVYTLDEDVTLLSTAGVQVGRVAQPAEREGPALWRAVDYLPCARLSGEWGDVTPLAVSTAISMRHSSRAARSITTVYVSQRPPLPPAHLWLENAGALALTGSRLQEFDLAAEQDRSRFAAAARADAIDATSWLATKDIVSRVLIEHEPAVDLRTTLTLATEPTRVLARLESAPRWPDSVSACRSTVGQVVVGYPGAPVDVTFDLRSGAWAGRGWHRPENDSNGVFRWTSEPRAEVRFFVGRAEDYLLLIGLMPAAASALDQVVVSLNGRPLARAPSVASAWQLPSHILREGANLLTLDTTVVAAPPGDRRQLGLRVWSIVLHRLTTE